jgi:hypothetical protein
VGSIHTKIAADGGATIHKRVDEDAIEVSVDDVGDEVAYIIVDHWTRKVVCGRTEEQAQQNLRRVRGTERGRAGG